MASVINPSLLFGAGFGLYQRQASSTDPDQPKKTNRHRDNAPAYCCPACRYWDYCLHLQHPRSSSGICRLGLSGHISDHPDGERDCPAACAWRGDCLCYGGDFQPIRSNARRRDWRRYRPTWPGSAGRPLLSTQIFLNASNHGSRNTGPGRFLCWHPFPTLFLTQPEL